MFQLIHRIHVFIIRNTCLLSHKDSEVIRYWNGYRFVITVILMVLHTMISNVFTYRVEYVLILFLGTNIFSLWTRTPIKKEKVKYFVIYCSNAGHLLLILFSNM